MSTHLGKINTLNDSQQMNKRTNTQRKGANSIEEDFTIQDIHIPGEI